VIACSPEEMAGPATCEKDRYAKTMRELVRRPDLRTVAFRDSRPKTANEMPSSVNEEKLGKMGIRGDSVLTSVFRDGTQSRAKRQTKFLVLAAPTRPKFFGKKLKILVLRKSLNILYL
jgi:hypothetical protein